MKIQTFSVVVGNKACNAKCPFCVAKMTPNCNCPLDASSFDVRKFKIGCQFAKNNNVSTVLLTGKGEPTLFPQTIIHYLQELNNEFPFVELQTNGSLLSSYRLGYLSQWYDLGLTTIALSIVHYDSKRNNEIYQLKKMIQLDRLIDLLHEFKYSVRLSCMMLGGYIDSSAEVDKLINFAKKKNVEQLTIRPIAKPAGADNKVAKWIDEHELPTSRLQWIREHLATNGAKLMELVHGATVYDVNGQNVCLSNCLTIEPEEKETIRQLIFIGDHLRYDWVYEGAILL